MAGFASVGPPRGFLATINALDTIQPIVPGYSRVAIRHALSSDPAERLRCGAPP